MSGKFGWLRRLGWEVGVAVLLIVACALIWVIEEHRRTTALAEQESRHQAATEEQESRHQAATEEQENRHQAALEALAQSAAENGAQAIFHAFASGIRPNLVAHRREAVDAALGELIRLEAVAFAHVFTPEGNVIATSDRKLATTGRADVRAGWATAASELAVRRGEGGVLEVGGPILGVDQPIAVLWIGCDGEVLVAAREPSEEL